LASAWHGNFGIVPCAAQETKDPRKLSQGISLWGGSSFSLRKFRSDAFWNAKREGESSASVEKKSAAARSKDINGAVSGFGFVGIAIKDLQ
jgi:hypothetical protein